MATNEPQPGEIYQAFTPQKDSNQREVITTGGRAGGNRVVHYYVLRQDGGRAGSGRCCMDWWLKWTGGRGPVSPREESR